MSSKSKKSSQPSKARNPAATTPGLPPGQRLTPEDEIVHVPKGKNRLQFYFMIGLMVFTLIIFTVGSQFVSSVGRGPGKNVYMRWEHPTLGKQSVGTIDFVSYKRTDDDFNRAATFGQYRDRSENVDETTAIEIIQDQLARDAGITITDAELAKAILEGVPGMSLPMTSKALYLQSLKFANMSTQRYQEVLRRKLRIRRWEQLLMSGFAQPTPELIEKKWKELHQERALDYVAIEHDSLLEAAQAVLPADEELTKWYDEQPDKQFWLSDAFQPARSKPEVVGIKIDGTADAAGLLARYPYAGTPEEAEQARLDYYNTRRSVRFKRPEPLPEESGQDPELRLFLPYEEVKPAVEREERILRALRSWLADLKLEVTGGKEVDLAAEAAALGLEHWIATAPMTREEIEAVEVWGGPYSSMTLLFSQVGMLNDAMVTPTAIFIGRVLERTESAPPAFADVRERVVERWKDKKTPELAKEKLQALHDKLFVAHEANEEEKKAAEEKKERIADHEPVDAENFSRTATEAGLTVQRRDWLMADGPVAKDPEWNDPAHEFLRGQASLDTLKEGELSQVLVDEQKGRSYLVRGAGVRDPEVVDIDPGDLELLRVQAGVEDYIEFRKRNMTIENYAKEYKLTLLGSTKIPEPN